MMCLLSGTGLRYNEKATVPGAQTERRGEAGPMSVLLRGWDSPAAFALQFNTAGLFQINQVGVRLVRPCLWLSVRSRNCLKRMNIRTLGDLTRVTEPQLLASKNFGETSLEEIKAIMAQKGLRIGQSLEQGQQYEFRYRPQANLSPEEQAVLGKPVSDLNLSVRARKCMNRLNITTLGELVQRTADELLEAKNFGQTSLTEVRERLGQFNLKLRHNEGVNLTNARTFSSFVSEIREGHSTVLFLPQYREPMATRILEASWDVLRTYPEYPGRERWVDRVYYRGEDGVARPLSVIWQNEVPWMLNGATRAVELFATTQLRSAFRLPLTPRGEILP